ncbi:hypothetical protein HDV01_004001 [Terramyces sp. JEL0728]|nr:hypothetical protein HDV01_003985 [Terramyces sp. JEL0728]KAJ3273722.1 hypothetical protein HDV01_004001 [Terramyces sp. JEL0728]
MDEILEIFPGVDREVIADVYAANEQNKEKTIMMLLEMGLGQEQPKSSNQEDLDLQYAKKLQAREERRLARQEQEPQGEEPPESPLLPELDFIKNGIQKGFDNIKQFYGKVSMINKVSSSFMTPEKTPRTEYTNLPGSNNFSKFLDEEPDLITPVRPSLVGRPSVAAGRSDKPPVYKTDEEFARALQEEENRIQ